MIATICRWVIVLGIIAIIIIKKKNKNNTLH